MGWITGGGKLYNDHHFKDTSLRWNRTSDLSNVIPNSRFWRPTGVAVDNIEYRIDGNNDRRYVQGAAFFDSVDNVTGLIEKAFTMLPSHYGSGQLFAYTVGTTNIAYQFETGTSNKRLLLRGNGLQALDNSTGASPQTLTLNNDGGDIVLRRKTFVGVGTGAEASAILQVNSTTQGFLPPKMTGTERDAISSPVDGLVIFNITTSKLQVRAGGAWVDLH